jgi:hypothetical protein
VQCPFVRITGRNKAPSCSCCEKAREAGSASALFYCHLQGAQPLGRDSTPTLQLLSCLHHAWRCGRMKINLVCKKPATGLTDRMATESGAWGRGGRARGAAQPRSRLSPGCPALQGSCRVAARVPTGSGRNSAPGSLVCCLKVVILVLATCPRVAWRKP